MKNSQFYRLLAKLVSVTNFDYLTNKDITEIEREYIRQAVRDGEFFGIPARSFNQENPAGALPESFGKAKRK